MLTDQYGFQYYEWPSNTWKLAKNIWSFIEVDPKHNNYYKVNVGMKYILYSKLRDVYEQYEVTEFTTDRDLLPYLKQQRLYLLP